MQQELSQHSTWPDTFHHPPTAHPCIITEHWVSCAPSHIDLCVVYLICCSSEGLSNCDCCPTVCLPDRVSSRPKQCSLVGQKSSYYTIPTYPHTMLMCELQNGLFALHSACTHSPIERRESMSRVVVLWATSISPAEPTTSFSYHCFPKLLRNCIIIGEESHRCWQVSRSFT